MGVYIRGMEMPKRGHTVTLTIMGGGEAVVQYYDCKPQLTVPIMYKAVPVPEHGDLIDRDSTIEKIRHLSDEIDKKLGYEKSAPYITMALYLSNADDFPTIIPADKEGEG